MRCSYDISARRYTTRSHNARRTFSLPFIFALGQRQMTFDLFLTIAIVNASSCSKSFYFSSNVHASHNASQYPRQQSFCSAHYIPICCHMLHSCPDLVATFCFLSLLDSTLRYQCMYVIVYVLLCTFSLLGCF